MRECQEERLLLIRRLLPYFGQQFVLKGGLALHLFYGLDRYSEDMDWDCRLGTMNFLDRLPDLSGEYPAWSVRVIKDAGDLFRVKIDYGGRLQGETYPLQVEASSRNVRPLQDGRLAVQEREGVLVYEIEVLCRMKLNAFANRRRARDLYDVAFLVRRYPEAFCCCQLQLLQETLEVSGFGHLAAKLRRAQKARQLPAFDPQHLVHETYQQAADLWIRKIALKK